METRIPPPLFGLVLCAAMWLVDRAFDIAQFQFVGQAMVAFVIVSIGVAISFSGFLSFRLSHTTVDPLHPDKATQLVVNGIYRLTRNPMYVGMLLVIAAWFIHLGALLNVVALPFFAWFITRFQIKPEEAALERLFGASFTDYCNRVRRWI